MNKDSASKEGWVCKNFECRNFETWIIKDVNPDRWCNLCSKELTPVIAEFKSYRVVAFLERYKGWLNLILSCFLVVVYLVKNSEKYIYSIWFDATFFCTLFFIVGWLIYSLIPKGSTQQLFLEKHSWLAQTNIDTGISLFEAGLGTIAIFVYVVWFN